ncbi:hypothetical protein SUG92_02880 [Streptococcus agalactiae]|uniref:Uncharacterized protein n=1 Tax=Helcococcus bovis TaxID=3153252 RepID=A0ABW9F6Q6_9FIRM|nr:MULTISPECIES: hypothetical protein [Streptococcus]KAF1268436.1 hypothetical protein B8V77_04460 [Streptococcus agalactiae]RRA52006.1 hypothetical protein D5F80_10645 [Streptococcus agalactiae]HEM6177519.1 hypothetical protein [Streptococcus suis]HEQ7722706.1 hypothetical protein [Streptococcus pyogenes]
MSKKSDKFENDLVEMVNNHIGESLPNDLPEWMIKEGIVPSSEIISCRGIGSVNRSNKTDVIIELSKGEPIKISAKLTNADYFGNWYGHVRFLEEFGTEAFERMTLEATKWANQWAETAIAPYVGVSICFGRRTGNTAQDFTDIFTAKDILTVARGFGKGEHVANCMIIDNTVPNSILNLINNLEEITVETVIEATESFKVAYRPINPMTEGTNRGKNVYTKFQPYESLEQPTVIENPRELFALGEFVTVEPTRLNHNHILDTLEDQYNIIVPRKL